jgi:predicted flap endonuclease-1-like 5' DNA nuclease
MPKKQKCICSVDLLSSVDKALNALEKSRKHAEKQKKHDKKAIAALLELEARIEDAGPCECKDTKKKKNKKKKKTKTGKIADGAAIYAANDVEEGEAVAVSNILELPHKSDNTPDDLELIAGIGPKLAQTLNELGVYRFEQIANWQVSDVERVDTHLNFSGRIDRENWIEQAKALAIGGRDEYVKVFGKEPR